MKKLLCSLLLFFAFLINLVPAFATYPGGAGLERLVYRQLSSSEILNLTTTPIQLLVAPGSGKTALVTKLFLRQNAGTGYSGSGPLRIVYHGQTTGLTPTINSSILQGNTPQNYYTPGGGNNSGNLFALQLNQSVSDNLAIDITNVSVAYTGGNQTMDVWLYYVIVP